MPNSSRLGADRAVNLLGVTKSAFFVIKPAFSRSLVCYATKADLKYSTLALLMASNGSIRVIPLIFQIKAL